MVYCYLNRFQFENFERNLSFQISFKISKLNKLDTLSQVLFSKRENDKFPKINVQNFSKCVQLSKSPFDRSHYFRFPWKKNSRVRSCDILDRFKFIQFNIFTVDRKKMEIGRESRNFSLPLHRKISRSRNWMKCRGKNSGSSNLSPRVSNKKRCDHGVRSRPSIWHRGRRGQLVQRYTVGIRYFRSVSWPKDPRLLSVDSPRERSKRT